MSHRRRAMTLLELLVVIAIVAALAAMLMPLAGGAWSMACSLQCQMNLKHVYEAFVLFDADDMAKEVIGPSAFYPEVEFWPGIPYIACQESQIFTCPSTEASPWEFAGSAPGDPQTADVPGEWDGSPPPSPPPSSPPAAQSEALSEFLNDLRYLNRVRGFEVSFGDPGHQGLGHMNLATREGQDGRGNYIEIGLDDNAVVTAGYMDGDGHDGIIRIYKESDGRVVAQLVKYSCG
jgi:prepilin-type N-terminal cleavage/methylation domain-containing protein